MRFGTILEMGKASRGVGELALIGVTIYCAYTWGVAAFFAVCFISMFLPGIVVSFQTDALMGIAKATLSAEQKDELDRLEATGSPSQLLDIEFPPAFSRIMMVDAVLGVVTQPLAVYLLTAFIFS